jgi:hypothetical protein
MLELRHTQNMEPTIDANDLARGASTGIRG